MLGGYLRSRGVISEVWRVRVLGGLLGFRALVGTYCWQLPWGVGMHVEGRWSLGFTGPTWGMEDGQAAGQVCGGAVGFRVYRSLGGRGGGG